MNELQPDIMQNLIEMFDHPDLRVKKWVVRELLHGDFSDEDREELIIEALNTSNVKLKEFAIKELFRSKVKISKVLIKQLLAILCISHNIKVVDLLIANLSKIEENKILPSIKEKMKNGIPELQKNLFFLLVDFQTPDSFDIILATTVKNKNTKEIMFFKEILDKKIRKIKEEKDDYSDFVEKVYLNMKNLPVSNFLHYMLKELLSFGKDSIPYFCTYFEESGFKDDIMNQLSKMNSQELFLSFNKKLSELKDEEFSRVMRVTLEVFAQINTEKVYELISNYHEKVEDFNYITEALKSINDVKLILNMLKNKEKALINIGLEIAQILLHPSILEEVVRLTKNPDENIRYRTISVLDSYDLSEVLGIFREMLSDPSENIQDGVLDALARHNNEAVNQVLLSELNNETLRDKIIQILGERNLETYFENFNDLNEKARSQMAKSLVKTSDKIVKKGIELCGSHEAEKRYIGVKTLSYVLPKHQDEILPVFKGMIEDPDAYIRSTISIALKDLDTPLATIILLTLLKDPNKRVRANCIESFLNTKNKPAIIKVLKGFLKDPNNRIKGNAVMVLYKLGDRSVLDEIEKMLDSEDKWMVTTALYTIGDLKINEFVYKVIELLQSKDRDIRKNALMAIIKINSPKFIVHIKRLGNDLDKEIRTIAQSYLSKIR